VADRAEYEELVVRGVTTLLQADRNNWELARLTHQATTGERAVPLARWAEDVRTKAGRRFSGTTAGKYRDMHVRFVLERPEGEELPTWTEAWVELQPRDSGPAMRERNTDIHLREATPARKAEVAAGLLADPEVRAAARDVNTPLGGALFGAAAEQREAVARTTRAQAEAADERFRDDPTDRTIRNARAITLLTGALSDYARAVAELLPEIRALPDADREALGARLFLREAYARALGATEQVGALLSTGEVGGDVDAWLASVLGEAQSGR
jgi:hypothetical protein